MNIFVVLHIFAFVFFEQLDELSAENVMSLVNLFCAWIWNFFHMNRGTNDRCDWMPIWQQSNVVLEITSSNGKRWPIVNVLENSPQPFGFIVNNIVVIVFAE